ncbi:quinoprotein [Aphanothece sacrum FPU1]|uniref:Quinoprotein n=2 Tax=Aphanothece sacrum TaxID=1122 RepID=A0A401IG46_APHSA|nr:quinoprotein [Aphanothece sacrum FPU1]
MVPALMTLASLPANALDLKGFSRPDDAACAVDFDCATKRGGVSDVFIILNPNGTIFDRIFAFGNEEADNIYYFDPAVVAVNPDEVGDNTTLLEPNGSWSDNFGIFSINGALALGFISDPQANIPPTGSIVYYEEPGSNPYGYILEGGPDSKALTQYYDATFYLHPDLQLDGYIASFQSDTVPEPLTMLGAGAALGFGSFFKRKLGKNNKQNKA